MYRRFVKDKEKMGVVEELLDVKEEEEYKRIGKKRVKVMITKWLVKWAGCDESENSWEPRESLDEASSEEYYLALSFSRFRADLTFLFYTHVISSEEIIADDMYNQFLGKKGGDRKKQKEARDAIFSKRAARATKKQKVSDLTISFSFIQRHTMSPLNYYFPAWPGGTNAGMWQFHRFFQGRGAAIVSIISSCLSFSFRDAVSKRRYVKYVIVSAKSDRMYYLILLSFSAGTVWAKAGM